MTTTRYVRPDASHLPGGTGTGDGLTYATAWAGLSSVVGTGVDDLVYAGTFNLSSTTNIPGMSGLTAPARYTHRGGYPGDPAVIQLVGTAFFNINRSYLNIDQIKFIGASNQAIYFTGGVAFITFTNCDFAGTVSTAPAVIRFDGGGGANYADIELGAGCTLTGTAVYGLLWIVFGAVTTTTTLTRITVRLACNGFVSKRAVIEMRIDPGAATGCRMEDIRIYGSCTNIAGIAYEISDAVAGHSAGFQFNATIDGTTPVSPNDADPTARLGGGLAVSGFARLGGAENRIDGNFLNIVGITGGIDTFFGDYALGDCTFNNISSESGFIDGSAIIADTGTYRLVQVGKLVATNIYGDKSANASNYAGGTALTILQATGVVINQFYASNVRLAVVYGNPIIPMDSTIVSITFAGNVATVTTSAAHGLIVGQRMLLSGQVPSVYSGIFNVASVPTTTTYTVNLGSTPASNATTVGIAYMLGAQSSTIRNMTCTGIFATTWLIGALTDQMANHSLEGCSFTMASSSLPLVVQFLSTVGAFQGERNNRYYGSALGEPNKRHTITSCLTAGMGQKYRR